MLFRSILSFATRWVSGDVALNDELDDARWLDPEDFGSLTTTEGLSEIVRAARALVTA